jgi:3-phenylpropionate/trans-cinnamate dioxygenase ferredoxin reductase subunit
VTDVAAGVELAASAPERIVVVGAGLAGVRTCAELRAGGHRGPLTLIGAEVSPPYDRPPLSKAMLRRGAEVERLELPAVDLRLGERAVALGDGEVRTTAGSVGFDALVLAFGAEPIRLGSERVLRTLDDSLALRAAFLERASVAIVGAGWIGAEVATAAAENGCAVTVYEAAATPLSVLGREVGAAIAPWFAAARVDLRLGARVTAVTADSVTLADGARHPADLVVSGLGVRPRLDWLADSGLELGSGVRTDSGGRTSRPAVYAVGDCAERYSPRRGRRVRAEHWDDALHAPAVVAANVLGGDEIYDPVPYVFSEQFGRYLQWCGWRDGEPDVWRGDPAQSTEWAAAWLDEAGRLVGFFAVDRPRDAVQARKVIAARRVCDRAKLADPSVPLRAV